MQLRSEDILAIEAQTGNGSDMDSDADLLGRYVSLNDADAFRHIVERHSGKVYGACLRVLGDAHAAEDAGQAVFLILARKARSLSRGTILSGWLHRTAYLVAREAQRKQIARRRHEEEAGKMRNTDELSAARTSAGWEQLQPTLDELIDELPAKLRDVLVLRYLDGRSEADVAAELHCPVGTISARLSRALAKLRDRLLARQIDLSVVMLASVLNTYATCVAPAHFTAATKAAALGTVAASSHSVGLANGMIKALFWVKVKVAMITVATACGIAVAAAILPVILHSWTSAVAAPTAARFPAGPTSVIFAPRSISTPLYYERLTHTTLSKPNLAALGNARFYGPDEVLDSQVIRLDVTNETVGDISLKFQTLRSYCETASRRAGGGLANMSTIFGIADSSTEKLPAFWIKLQADGNYHIQEQGIQGVAFTTEKASQFGFIDGGVGVYLMERFGFAPFCSTSERSRSIGARWTIENDVRFHGELRPIIRTVQLDAISNLEGRLEAVVRTMPFTYDFQGNVLPDGTTQANGITVKLQMRTLNIKVLSEITRVDVQRGVVLEHSQVLEFTLVHHLEVPLDAPADLNNARISLMQTTGRINVTDTLIEEGQADALRCQPAPAAQRDAVIKRWAQRIEDAEDSVSKGFFSHVLSVVKAAEAIPVERTK